MTDADFLANLLADPADDATRLVYADWLEEQGDPGSAARAEFLRATARLAALTGRQQAKAELDKRLRQLAAGLDTDWLAVVSRLPIENCQRKWARAVGRPSGEGLFRFLCDRRWENLQTTDDQAVRFCEGCRKKVHYCDTITEARRHAERGHCIAIDLGVIRRSEDLEPRRMWLGEPSEETLRQEEERMQPDSVSAERERQKARKDKGS
jgi:uncharacterized protein (TIGR02996 family)